MSAGYVRPFCTLQIENGTIRHEAHTLVIERSSMLRQPIRYLACLLFSLLAGITVTLVMDRVENIFVEKRIRTELVQEIQGAVAAFKASTGRTTPAEVIIFINKFIASAEKDKIIAVDPGMKSPQDSATSTFLSSFQEGERRVDCYIVTSYLKNELAILEVPELVSGLIITIIVFAALVVHAEKKKEFSRVLEEHEALALLGRMVATLAHELKTPIATISNLVQTLPNRIEDKHFIDRFITLTNSELNRTQQLISNLLAYGKEIEARRCEWFDLAPVLAAAATKNSLTIESPASVMIHGDRFYFDLLCDNLLRNSRTAGATHVNVTIATHSTAGDGALLCLEDNGKGFPNVTDLTSLLDPFMTLHSSGAGLGLYLAAKIAAAHNGVITLYRPEQGAGVSITLPPDRIKVHGQV